MLIALELKKSDTCQVLLLNLTIKYFYRKILSQFIQEKNFTNLIHFLLNMWNCRKFFSSSFLTPMYLFLYDGRRPYMQREIFSTIVDFVTVSVSWLLVPCNVLYWKMMWYLILKWIQIYIQLISCSVSCITSCIH